MNQQIQSRINESLQQVRMSNKSGSHLNCIRLTNNNVRTKHTEEIISRCLEYIENDVPFMTEVIFNDNSRCDILLPSLKVIEEICYTETDERFSEKIKKYPDCFRVIKVRV